MAKVKLLRFEIISLLSESKRLMDYLQKIGFMQIDNVDEDGLKKTETADVCSQFKDKSERALAAAAILEKYCNIKRSFVESFSDYRSLDYSEYRVLADKADDIEAVSNSVLNLNGEIEELRLAVNENSRLIEYYGPWRTLDIPMASKRTLYGSIFIGMFNGDVDEQDIISMISEADPELVEPAVEIISNAKLYTCAVIMTHKENSDRMKAALDSAGFTMPEKVAASTPAKEIEKLKNQISELEEKIKEKTGRIKEYADRYDDIRFFYDYAVSQAEKYAAFENSAQTESTFVVRGYLPESAYDEIKFDIENKFICQIEAQEPDYDDPDVPVLIKNGSFGSGVESITNMYSPPSNKDIDPNTIMAFFYYVFFGFMLSDAGYGILMILFSVIARKKFKVSGNSRKFTNMVFYSGISTVFWGAMFGGWFGDLIPIICTEFLGYEQGPELALWLEPVSNSMTLLLFSLGMGILQLFAGLIIRFYMLIKERRYVDAFSETIPVMVFIVGFAIIGAGIIVSLPDNISKLGLPLIGAGALLIVLTGGRSSKSIIGKFGGGLYALYNTATGYIGDILSYSRLLALSLVTGVVAGAVNMLAAMPGNIIIFVPIFIFGHVLNIAINLIGTYVHTNRLQYVEFFSKFYEGSGKEFRPFRLSSKYHIIKEDKKYE
ncbi:MAG: V-type ATP synthase subunit I [Clostridia bacterium]|nr:V-type ATP synthase subunit I [Clostridia bacterium]